MGPRASPDAMARRKIPSPCQESKSARPARSLVTILIELQHADFIKGCIVSRFYSFHAETQIGNLQNTIGTLELCYPAWFEVVSKKRKTALKRSGPVRSISSDFMISTEKMLKYGGKHNMTHFSVSLSAIAYQYATYLLRMAKNSCSVR
jgi:hypothetical protein